MVKKGRLTKAEKYYIEGNTNLPVEDIAKDLDRSVPVIEKHLAQLDLPKEEPAPAKPEKKEDPKILQLMGRKERAGQHVATVMTPAASELADETRPNRIVNKKIQAAIHKPRG